MFEGKKHEERTLEVRVVNGGEAAGCKEKEDSADQQAEPLWQDCAELPRVCIGMPPLQSELGRRAQWAVVAEEWQASRGYGARTTLVGRPCRKTCVRATYL